MLKLELLGLTNFSKEINSISKKREEIYKKIYRLLSEGNNKVEVQNQKP